MYDIRIPLPGRFSGRRELEVEAARWPVRNLAQPHHLPPFPPFDATSCHPCLPSALHEHSWTWRPSFTKFYPRATVLASK
jgi:hypothetical protein